MRNCRKLIERQAEKWTLRQDFHRMIKMSPPIVMLLQKLQMLMISMCNEFACYVPLMFICNKSYSHRIFTFLQLSVLVSLIKLFPGNASSVFPENRKTFSGQIFIQLMFLPGTWRNNLTPTEIVLLIGVGQSVHVISLNSIFSSKENKRKPNRERKLLIQQIFRSQISTYKEIIKMQTL